MNNDFFTPSGASYSVKMNFQEGIKTLQNGDKEGAMTLLNAAKQTVTNNSSPEAIWHFEEGMNESFSWW